MLPQKAGILAYASGPIGSAPSLVPRSSISLDACRKGRPTPLSGVVARRLALPSSVRVGLATPILHGSAASRETDMRRPTTTKMLEEFGRVRLSPSFFMRDFLYSEIAATAGLLNVPSDPDLAIAAGTKLCTELLEPLQQRFGRIAVRSAYRSEEVNAFGNAHGLNCASNERNFAGHIWDCRDAGGHMGATACVVVPAFWDRFQAEGDWRRLAWWIHDHLPYAAIEMFPRYWAMNLTWHEAPQRTISSFAAPRGVLTRPGMANWAGAHTAEWQAIDEALPG